MSLLDLFIILIAAVLWVFLAVKVSLGVFIVLVLLALCLERVFMGERILRRPV